MNALYEALKAVKSEIITIPASVRPVVIRQSKPAAVTSIRPKQFVNGYEVLWVSYEGSSRKIPIIQEDHFMVQYPTSSSDIKLPEGTSRASYNPEKKRVEFFARGSDKPIRYVADSKHEPLPLPRYFSELETIEEIFDINMETGEISSVIKVEVMDESVHWKLRLQEFESQQIEDNVSPKVISFRLQKYLKNLEAQRGVTVEMLSRPIPKAVLDAITYAEKKQLAIAVGGK